MLRPTAWLGHPARPRLHALLPLRFPSLSVYGRACPAEVSSTLSLLSLLGSIINCRGRTLTCWSIKEQRLHRLRRTLINPDNSRQPKRVIPVSLRFTNDLLEF